VSGVPLGSSVATSTQQAELLRVQGLKTYFYTRHGIAKSVDGVDFHLHQGEHLGLIGESGSGKSVTALSIMRLIRDPPGRIVAGEIADHGPRGGGFTGAEVARLRAAGECDDAYFDASRKRIYVIGAEGRISVFQQNDPDHYELVANVPSSVGIRTGYYFAKRDRFYVAVPAKGTEPAQVWTYEAED